MSSPRLKIDHWVTPAAWAVQIITLERRVCSATCLQCCSACIDCVCMAEGVHDTVQGLLYCASLCACVCVLMQYNDAVQVQHSLPEQQYPFLLPALFRLLTQPVLLLVHIHINIVGVLAGPCCMNPPQQCLHWVAGDRVTRGHLPVCMSACMPVCLCA